MTSPKTRYAQRGDVSIAFQVLGDGPIDLVLVNGLVAHMDLFWLDPNATAMLSRLASFSRLILFDKPGTGLSDPVAGAPTVEQRMEDVRTVMDAVGSERAALLGYSEGGFPAALFAATYPEKVEALILLSTAARFAEAPDPEFGFHDEVARCWRDLNELAIGGWGEGEFALRLAPSWRRDEVFQRLAPVVERASASPGMVRAIAESMRHYDMRAILPAIDVRTLVLHPSDEWIDVELGRDLASRIPGARFFEFPGRDHVVFAGDWRPMVDEIEEFLTGGRTEHEPDRVLRTILFTDIVGSTQRAAELGDRRWRELLDRHDELVHAQLGRFGGRAVKSLGDGFLAAFDGTARAVRCAQAICAEASQLGIEVRAGLHSGECDAVGDDLGGLAVNIGARVGALAGPGEVLVSGTVCDLVVGSGLQFADRGPHELKGVPGVWRLYAATGDAPAESRAVASADHAAAVLTPGAAATMRPVDRFVVAIAKHAPGVSRAGLRLARARRRTDRGDLPSAR